MLKFGYITELNIEEGTVRVNFTDDGIVSNPLPVSVPAAKEDKYSFPFVINEQVWCLMDDNCEFGVVGGAIYSQKDKPATGSNADTILININSNKFKLTIDRQTGDLEVNGQGNVKVTAAKEVDITGTTKVKVQSASVTIQAANTTVSGNMAVAGSLTAGSFGGAGGAPASAPNGLSAVGAISSATDVVAAGISLKTHKHLSGSSGSPTSTPLP